MRKTLGRIEAIEEWVYTTSNLKFWSVVVMVVIIWSIAKAFLDTNTNP